jgi:hypothetical protein
MAATRKPRKGSPKGRPDEQEKPEGAGLEEEILERYSQAGMQLLSDDLPTRLDPTLRREMETLVGGDLPDIRLHTGEKARAMADSLGARAFTAGGGDVFFGQGELSTATPEGKALLAHELTHVAEGHIGLSRPVGRPEKDALEDRARAREAMVLAQEQQVGKPPEDGMLEAQTVAVPVEAKGEPVQKDQEVTIDKQLLEEKVYALLERDLARERERQGRY